MLPSCLTHAGKCLAKPLRSCYRLPAWQVNSIGPSLTGSTHTRPQRLYVPQSQRVLTRRRSTICTLAVPQGTSTTADRASADRASADRARGGAGRLVLVDAHALLYRYNFGGARLSAASGEDTSIAYGFIGTLLSLLEVQPPPTHFIVVLDAAGKTFRHELFPGYKGQRPPLPGGIKLALPRILEFLEAMGLPVMRISGLEADDVIGTVATRAVQEGLLVAIASPDKDFFQLLRPGLQLLRPPKKDTMHAVSVAGMVPYNEQAFVAEYGIQPVQWTDVLALSGDAADNVPGVKGVGLKSAVALLQKYKDVETVLLSASEVKRKKQREELLSEGGQAAARLSKRLVSIQTDVDVPPLRGPIRELTRLKTPTPEQRAATEGIMQDMDFKQQALRLQKVWANLAPPTD